MNFLDIKLNSNTVAEYNAKQKNLIWKDVPSISKNKSRLDLAYLDSLIKESMSIEKVFYEFLIKNNSSNIVIPTLPTNTDENWLKYYLNWWQKERENIFYAYIENQNNRSIVRFLKLLSSEGFTYKLFNNTIHYINDVTIKQINEVFDKISITDGKETKQPFNTGRGLKILDNLYEDKETTNKKGEKRQTRELSKSGVEQLNALTQSIQKIIEGNKEIQDEVRDAAVKIIRQDFINVVKNENGVARNQQYFSNQTKFKKVLNEKLHEEFKKTDEIKYNVFDPGTAAEGLRIEFIKLATAISLEGVKFEEIQKAIVNTSQNFAKIYGSALIKQAKELPLSLPEIPSKMIWGFSDNTEEDLIKKIEPFIKDSLNDFVKTKKFKEDYDKLKQKDSRELMQDFVKDKMFVFYKSYLLDRSKAQGFLGEVVFPVFMTHLKGGEIKLKGAKVNKVTSQQAHIDTSFIFKGDNDEEKEIGFQVKTYNTNPFNATFYSVENDTFFNIFSNTQLFRYIHEINSTNPDWDTIFKLRALSLYGYSDEAEYIELLSPYISNLVRFSDIGDNSKIKGAFYIYNFRLIPASVGFAVAYFLLLQDLKKSYFDVSKIYNPTNNKNKLLDVREGTNQKVDYEMVQNFVKYSLSKEGGTKGSKTAIPNILEKQRIFSIMGMSFNLNGKLDQYL